MTDFVIVLKYIPVMTIGEDNAVIKRYHNTYQSRISEL